MNGNNSQNIENNQNAQALKMMGYIPPTIPPSDPALLHQFIINQYNQQSASKLNNEINRQKHLVEILNEANEIENSNHNTVENNSETLQNYQSAFSKLNDMLIGKTKLSFTNAIYTVENAYGKPYLNYNEYIETIKQSADYIKNWLKQQNAPLTPQNLHYAIQQFMGTKTSIKIFSDDKKNTKNNYS